MKIQKPTLVLLGCLFIFGSAIAQIPENIRPKLQGLLPFETLREADVYFGSSELKTGSPADIPVVIEVSAPEIFTEIENLGGRVNTRDGNLATVQLPKKLLAAVAILPGVVSLEYNKVWPQTDLVQQHTRANLVQQGLNPLPKGYSGQGVVVGVVDFGIDIKHPDFRDLLDGHTRILAIWDQVSSAGTPPTGFSYGSLWTKNQIEAELGANPPGLINISCDDPFTPGHGTHVAGIAAGNEGMAPLSEIVFVHVNGSATDIVDGIKFIRDYAQNVGKPCVVNLSIGTAISNHEGNTNYSKLIDNLVAGTTGFSVVAAAGNEGFSRGHWGGFDLKNDTAMMFTGLPGELYAYFRVPKIYGDSLFFAVGADSAHFDPAQLAFTGGTLPIGATAWQKVGSLSSTTKWFYRPSGAPAGFLEIIPFSSPFNYHQFAVHIIDLQDVSAWFENAPELDIYRFMFRGTGNFHSWLGNALPLPGVIANPADIGLPTQYFVPSDNDFGILSPADGKNILAAGAYVNRPEWTDVIGDTHHFLSIQQTGELADFSSHGPTFDGRVKPDICAPGKHIIATYPSSFDELHVPFAFFSPDNPLWFFTDTLPARACYSGTSMASPAVAGCVALLLEAKPDLTFSEVRDLLTSTALTDAFTAASGTLPNGLFGYGKIDIFLAILATLGLSETHNALIDNGLTVFPNPASERVFFNFENPASGHLTLSRADGAVVFLKKIEAEPRLEIPVSELPTGVYFWKMTAENGGTASGKVQILTTNH